MNFIKENIVPYYLQEIKHKRLVADKVIYIYIYISSYSFLFNKELKEEIQESKIKKILYTFIFDPNKKRGRS